MKTRFLAAAVAFGLAACATVPTAPADTLDAIGRDYVLLQLTIGEKEDGYIDAYYGPAETKARAVADAPAATIDSLTARVAGLEARAAAFADDGDPENSLAERRARFLVAQLVAARTRLRMMGGQNLPFVEEAEGLFGVRPELRQLASYDPLLARIDALVPGAGPVWQRVEALRARFEIPADRVRPVMDAAIAECRRRTIARIPLPAAENFALALVTDKPWSGYNYYQGDYRSKIEINTDLPVRIDRAIDLGCHEGYPGHHVYNLLLERELVDTRGWAEFEVNPLYSPQSIISEGSANYGIELAFPGDEANRFTRETLAPIAGIPVDDLDRFMDLNRLALQLRGAEYTIAADYLAGRIDRVKAQELLQRYSLSSPERAAQRVRFIDTYRSYVINYGLGLDMVRGYVEAAGPSQDARWKRMERLLSEPVLPEDLKAR